MSLKLERMKHYQIRLQRKNWSFGLHLRVMTCVCRQHDFVRCESQPGIAGSWLTFSENDFVMQLVYEWICWTDINFGSVGYWFSGARVWSWVVFSLVYHELCCLWCWNSALVREDEQQQHSHFGKFGDRTLPSYQTLNTFF